MYKQVYSNANSAYEDIFKTIKEDGIKKQDTVFIQNCFFTILNPLDNIITNSNRKWKKQYADLEWEWYLSGNNSVKEIRKHAKIWDKMHSGNFIVNSNYGYQWKRKNQLDNIVQKLIENKHTRQAVISLYDGKEIEIYKHDTPCTLSISFNYVVDRLDMTVLMRSNDLYFGFCNDQYCFSKLFELVCNKTGLKIGKYHHLAIDMHIYKDFIDKI